MVKEPYSIERFRRFYRRNSIGFLSIGLIVFGHIFWWQIQQNKIFVQPQERKRSLGPFKIPYLDELDYFKNKRRQDNESDESNQEK